MTGEKFIATYKNGLKSYVSFTRNGGLCRHTQMFQSAEPFDNFGFAKVTDYGPGENNTYLIDKSWERATSYYKDISLPNENGNRLFKVVDGSIKVLDKNFRKIGDYREVYMYDENGKLLPPTSKTPVKDYNGRVGIVDMGRDVLGNVTNFINALSITEPSKYDVIRLSKYTADGLVQKNIVLREDREQDLLIIDGNNAVEDICFYNTLVESFDKYLSDVWAYARKAEESGTALVLPSLPNGINPILSAENLLKLC